MLAKGFLLMSVHPVDKLSKEPWRHASFTKEVIIPSLLSVYQHLDILIYDTVQAYNLHDWGLIPDCSIDSVSDIFSHPSVVAAFKVAKENVRIRAEEIKKDLNDFLSMHPEMGKRITILFGDDEDISTGLQILKDELNNPSTEFIQDFVNCINITADNRLNMVLKNHPLLTDIQKKLIREGSKHYLLEECAQLRKLLFDGAVEDIWYSGTFNGEKNPVLFICKKNDRQRFHRLDPNDRNAAMLSIQKVSSKLRSNLPIVEDTETEKIQLKIDKVSKALMHLRDSLPTEFFHEMKPSSGNLNLLEQFLDTLNDQLRKQIKELRRSQQAAFSDTLPNEVVQQVQKSPQFADS